MRRSSPWRSPSPGSLPALGTAFALIFACASCDDRPVPAGPDVILITVDTLRADRLGFAGHAGAVTPNVDALAARGRVFTQATTPLPRTTPALASLLTGRAPGGLGAPGLGGGGHGSTEVGVPMTAGVPTLATRLHALGWETLAVSGTPVAGPDQGLDAGFETFVVMPDPPARDLTARALGLVQKADPDRPVLLWVHYTDPHFPYLPPVDAPVNPAAPACRELAKKVTSGKLRRWRVFGDTGGVASAAKADCDALYDAEIAHMDAAVGTLLSGLGARAQGLVVFSADHGENMGEDGLWYEHGPTVADASLRVPLVIGGPGIAPGEDGGVARLEDVAPTLLATLGLPPLPSSVGGDLRRAPSVRAPVALARSGSALHARLAVTLRAGRADDLNCLHGPVFSLCSKGFYDRRSDRALRQDRTGQHPEDEARLATWAARWPAEQTFQYTVRSPRWKLVATPTAEGGYRETVLPVGQGGWQLGAESATAASGETVGALRAALPAVVREGLASSETVGPRSDETADRLRALGYVE
jgi:arylsulfatase A-like enzyme